MKATNADVVFFDAKLKEEREFWLRKLAGELVTSAPPPDRERAPEDARRSESLHFEVDEETRRALGALVGQSQFLLYAALLAALEVCLYRYTRNETVLVGSPALKELGRENALTVAVGLDGEKTFRQLLLDVRAALLEAYANQRYPVGRLLKDLGQGGAGRKCPLFDVSLALASIHGGMPDVGQDVSIEFVEEAGALKAEARYNPAVYDPETIRRFTAHYLNVLRAGVAATGRRLHELPLLGAEERHELLVLRNETVRDFGPERCLHEWVEAQVELTPDAVAVISEEEQVTYAELNRRANRLARRLRELGVGPDVPVGVCVERSVEMVVGLLGVLKAGGAYVPLDPEYPQERLAFMLENTGARVLLTQQRLVEVLPPFEGRVLCLDAEEEAADDGQPEENPRSGVKGDNLAYVIYTSGSTGRAKGVMIAHRSICNRVLWTLDRYPLGPSDRLLQKTPFTFDASVWELFAPLMSGAQLVMARPGGHRECAYMAGVIAAKQVTFLQLVPSMLQVFLSEAAAGDCRSLRHVFCGGEVLPAQLQERFHERLGAELHNLYGPTEVSIDATSWDCERDRPRQVVPIGRPIANMRVYVLDEELEPVPVGVVGELYVAGVGLARGYLERPDLTAEKFIPDPYSPGGGGRLYRTGDHVLARGDGSIEYVGRGDGQVKVRGFRIELGEIETALARHESVREAVVTAREDEPGEKRLVAYVVAVHGHEAAAAELRAHLRKELPEYMVPSAFVELERLPLNANGKLDRHALPAPGNQRPELEYAFAAPRTVHEELLAEVWARVLGVERVGIHDNFFDLGGHSLLATQIVARAREVFRLELPLRSLFEHPTVAGLAAHIATHVGTGHDTEEPPIEKVARTGDLPLSFTQQRLWLLDQLKPGSSVYNLLTVLRLRGALDVDALEQSLSEIVRRHEVLRTSFPIRGGQPVQAIAPPQPVRIPVRDLRHLADGTQEAEAQRMTQEEGQLPFDLATGPLLRVSLLRLRDDEHLALVTLHHIISDGWSVGRLVDEVATLYDAYRQGHPSPLAELPIQYGDYAVWQRGWLQGEVLGEQLAYWRRQLGGALPALDLPTDRPRPAVQSFRGANQWLYLSEELTAALKKQCLQEGVTLYMLLLAAFQTLLHRYTGQDDITVGSPIANRRRPEIEPLIGCFINTLVMRTDLSGDPTFRELLGRVRETSLAAYAHQDVPLELLAETLRPEREANYAPFFRVVFALQNAPLRALELPGLTLSALELDGGSTQFDLILSLVESGGQLKGTLTYSTDLFDADTVAEMLRHFRLLLEAVVANPDRRLLDIPLGRSEGEGYGRVAVPAPGAVSPDQFVM
ncbi:MAG: amino acid adenylation domain-containing protein [Acidobacteria bacterium]|nr:amino acid adenylation domain-containing protein [Acidobacteriota bacterium]